MAAKNLLIVESPGKIKTLSKFLGKSFVVEASKGHIMDLPKTKLGVDVDAGFAPDYHEVKEKGEVIKKLKDLASKADQVFLAPDPDREGEAISWHLARVLGIKESASCRVTFNSITRDAVVSAIEHPSPINMNLVMAQQSRRILDRLVGYKLSPLLWKKVQKGLSAGRVQSVAVMLICHREREIRGFKKEEYWTIKAIVKTDKGESFEAKLTRADGKKLVISNKAAADAILDELSRAAFGVSAVNRRSRKQTPPPPFITSTLQQEAARRFGFTAKRTMSIAQKLYEGVNIKGEGQVGLITYMRTDSVRIAPEALTEANEYVTSKFGKEYALAQARVYRTKKGAQDAHEAVRPAAVQRHPDTLTDDLDKDELKLYTLIWRRFVATQMAEALFDVLAVDINAGRYTFQVTGTTLKFDGYMSVYQVARDEDEDKERDAAHERGDTKPDEEADTEADTKQTLPELAKGQALTLGKLDPKQNFTQPPPRYSEAMLIKTLEKEGIGRPSTYSTIIDTIQQRNYVRKVEGRFMPTDAAFLTNNLLTEHFTTVINTSFTAQMEDLLDQVEDGAKNWVAVLGDFYKQFVGALKHAEDKLKRVEITTDCVCPNCQHGMVVKFGRAGKFLACSHYPECKTTENIPEDMLLFADAPQEGKIALRQALDDAKASAPPVTPIETDEVCDKCGSKMVVRTGRFGRFLACPGYPKCKNTKPIQQDLGIACPKAGCPGKITIKRTKTRRIFYGCTAYPKCDFVTWGKPTGTLCPQCQSPMVENVTKKLGTHAKCSNKECKHVVVTEGAEGGAGGDEA